MAQVDAIKRQIAIINYLTNHGGQRFADITNHLQIESEIYDLNLNISIRTFQRDIKAIKKLYDIEIYYNKSKKLYEIDNAYSDNKSIRLLESFNMLNTLNLNEQFSKFLYFEDKANNNNFFIMDIITAIKNNHILEIYHKKYTDTDYNKRRVEPLALKEYRYRWYMIAKDQNDNKIKAFGLDRIKHILTTNIRFAYPKDFDVKEYFKHSYGVISSDDKPSKIILSFDAFQGNYIKSLPLHHSQKILIDNKDELRISLKLIPTYDFIMDLQYFGQNVKVLEPKWLANEIKNNFKEALEQYL